MNRGRTEQQKPHTVASTLSKESRRRRTMFARRVLSCSVRGETPMFSQRACLATMAARAGGGRRKWVYLGGLVGAAAVAYPLRETDLERSFRETLARDGPADPMTFRDTETAFKNKSLSDLMTSMVIFKMCSMTWLVRMSATMIQKSVDWHVSAPVFFGVRHTFFRYFCAGENASEARRVLDRLTGTGLHSVLDLSMENDAAKGPSLDHCDMVASKIIEGIDTVAAHEGSSMAVKVTALSLPTTLLRLTNRLQYINGIFEALDMHRKGTLSLEEFRDGVTRLGLLPDGEDCTDLFRKMDSNNDGALDIVDFQDAFPVMQPMGQTLFATKGQTESSASHSAVGPPPAWTEEDINGVEDLLNRMDRICSTAKKMGVQLMVDAEQWYFQPAISYVALAMARRFNRDTALPVVFNTHQMYLREGVAMLRTEIERARREGWVPGFKLVRGAYMVSEGQRAHSLNMQSPVCDTKAQADAHFNEGVAIVLREIAAAMHINAPQVPAVMVASHNEESARLAVREANRLGIPHESRALSFGQLLGMCDHVSYTLAANGYTVAKYVPYGPVRETIPYLMRRAQENSAVLANNNTEPTLLWMEIKRRLAKPLRTRATTGQTVLPVPSQK